MRIIRYIVIILFLLFGLSVNLSDAQTLGKKSETLTINVGPFLDTDGLTEQESLGTQTATLHEADGTTTILSVDRPWVHTNDGFYDIGLFGTETTNIGDARISFSDPANHIIVWHDIEIVTADAYNMRRGGDVFENSKSFGYYMKCLFSFAFGKTSGSGGTPITFRDMADGKDRISATIGSGNRTTVTLDGD